MSQPRTRCQALGGDESLLPGRDDVRGFLMGAGGLVAVGPFTGETQASRFLRETGLHPPHFEWVEVPGEYARPEGARERFTPAAYAEKVRDTRAAR